MSKPGGRCRLSDRTFGLKLIVVAAVAILLILRLVIHITLTFLLPLIILLGVLFLGLVIGSRMFLRR